MFSRVVSTVVPALLSAALFAAPAVVADDDMTCVDCHDLDAPAYENSVHGFMDCIDCHMDADPLPHEDELSAVDCAMCHDDVAEMTAASVHGQDCSIHGWETPGCQTCHGDAHSIMPSSDESSPMYEKNQAKTCGECHGNPDYLDAKGIRTVRPIAAYESSVHSRAVQGGVHAATCSSCHTPHSITHKEEVDSSISRQHVHETCGTCHEEIARQYVDSIHGEAFFAGLRESPTCIDCHGEHQILSPMEDGSPTSASNIPLVTCGRCHADLRLSAKYGMPDSQVPAYADSYHGLASRAGAQSVAHCASCHGVHDIRPSSDPRSHIHPDNLAETCGECHRGAGQRYAIGPVHVLAKETRTSAAYWVRLIYLPLIWITILGMLAHNGLDFIKKVRHPEPQRFDKNVIVEERMPKLFRLAHLLVFPSFIILVFTGFALKYPEAWWARPFVAFDAGNVWRALLHRVFGVVMIAGTVLHFVHLAVSRDARARMRKFIPGIADLRELQHRMAYYLGKRKDPPHGVKVGYIEKSEYWAFMWGTIVMVVSGFALWFENWTLAYLPGWAADLATSVHFYEAILASLAILVWHLYWVMFDPAVYPMDTTWLTGKPPILRAEERGEIIEDPEADARASADAGKEQERFAQDGGEPR